MHKLHRQRWKMVALSVDPKINDMRTAKHAAVNGMLLKVCFQAIGGRTPMTEIGRVADINELVGPKFPNDLSAHHIHVWLATFSPKRMVGNSRTASVRHRSQLEHRLVVLRELVDDVDRRRTR